MNFKQLVGLSLVAVLGVAACNDGTSPVASPVTGLDRVATTDTGTTTPPPPPVGVGSFHGVVRGYQTGTPDTLSTVVVLEGVRVTAYARVATASDSIGVGPQGASVLTDASGVFQLPDLAAGDYVVTFTTPAGSKYAGGWTVATASATSNQSPWWIMLAEK